MPLKLNVGASRKVTDNNYGSRGASLNLAIELDSALADDPPKLHEKIRHLFGLVRTSLREELNGGSGPADGRGSAAAEAGDPQPARPAANGSARSAGARGAGFRRSTASQCKALYAISRAQNVDLASYLRERFQLRRPEHLSIQEASQAIDDLKAADVPAGGGP
jgi:hypothetical protein